MQTESKYKFKIDKYTGSVTAYHEDVGTRDSYNNNQPYHINYATLGFGVLSGCCGVKEISGFHKLRRLPKSDKASLLKIVFKAIKKNKQGLFLANFVKIGDRKKYDDQDFMEALLNFGFQKLGDPHYNRRYRKHLIQTIFYRHPKSVIEIPVAVDTTVVPPVIGE